MNPAKLILACRSQEKGDQAVKCKKLSLFLWFETEIFAMTAIAADTGYKSECWTLDLASFKSVSAFVDRFEKEGGGRLDILLENAGVALRKFDPTPDGWDQTSASFLTIPPQ